MVRPNRKKKIKPKPEKGFYQTAIEDRQREYDELGQELKILSKTLYNGLYRRGAIKKKRRELRRDIKEFRKTIAQGILDHARVAV